MEAPFPPDGNVVAGLKTRIQGTQDQPPDGLQGGHLPLHCVVTDVVIAAVILTQNVIV